MHHATIAEEINNTGTEVRHEAEIQADGPGAAGEALGRAHEAHIKAGPDTQATTSACAGVSGAAEIGE